MQLSSVSLTVLAVCLLAGGPAKAQPAPDTNATQKPPTQAGAYREYSDPKAWDAEVQAGTSSTPTPAGLRPHIDFALLVVEHCYSLPTD